MKLQNCSPVSYEKKFKDSKMRYALLHFTFYSASERYTTKHVFAKWELESSLLIFIAKFGTDSIIQNLIYIAIKKQRQYWKEST